MGQIREHFEANMLDWEKVKEWRSTMDAAYVLRFIEEYYELKDPQKKRVWHMEQVKDDDWNHLWHIFVYDDKIQKK